MNIPETKHEKTKVDEYIKKGFTAQYRVDDGMLKDLETGKKFDACDVTIYDEYRYEGMSNPSDMSIMYAVKTADGGKGTIVTPYGMAKTTNMAAFMAEVTLNQSK